LRVDIIYPNRKTPLLQVGVVLLIRCSTLRVYKLQDSSSLNHAVFLNLISASIFGLILAEAIKRIVSTETPN